MSSRPFIRSCKFLSKFVEITGMGRLTGEVKTSFIKPFPSNPVFQSQLIHQIKFHFPPDLPHRFPGVFCFS